MQNAFGLILCAVIAFALLLGVDLTKNMINGLGATIIIDKAFGRDFVHVILGCLIVDFYYEQNTDD